MSVGRDLEVDVIFRCPKSGLRFDYDSRIKVADIPKLAVPDRLGPCSVCGEFHFLSVSLGRRLIKSVQVTLKTKSGRVIAADRVESNGKGVFVV
jgi:hypothetical protein